MVTQLTLTNLTSHFNNEDSARELLEKLRWQNGTVCPHCGSLEAYKLQGKPKSTRPVERVSISAKPVVNSLP